MNGESGGLLLIHFVNRDLILVLKKTRGSEKLPYVANMWWNSGLLSPRAGLFSGAESSGS